jgi:hypothetical protein
MNAKLSGVLDKRVTKGALFCAALMVLVFAIPPTAKAEFLIYLKGGHYIVADNCTFLSRQDVGENAEGQKEPVPIRDCTEGKPEGPIYWSTIDGKFGEVNADDVYAIFGSKTLTQKRTLPGQKPLEDYLITNREESIVNAKSVEQKEDAIYGIKRDELAKINRRSVTDIAREGEAKSRSGEGLCAGEPAEFSVTETEPLDGRFGGIVTNQSQAAWKPEFYVEVREKGKFKGKFLVAQIDVLSPGDFTSFDEAVPSRLVEYVKRAKEPEASVQICYRKVKTGAARPGAAQAPSVQPPR